MLRTFHARGGRRRAGGTAGEASFGACRSDALADREHARGGGRATLRVRHHHPIRSGPTYYFAPSQGAARCATGRVGEAWAVGLLLSQERRAGAGAQLSGRLALLLAPCRGLGERLFFERYFDKLRYSERKEDTNGHNQRY